MLGIQCIDLILTLRINNCLKRHFTGVCFKHVRGSTSIFIFSASNVINQREFLIGINGHFWHPRTSIMSSSSCTYDCSIHPTAVTPYSDISGIGVCY